MVELNFRPLLYMWKPFHYFFARFHRQWGIQTTIMDAFVTFFFLSATKLLSASEAGHMCSQRKSHTHFSS